MKICRTAFVIHCEKISSSLLIFSEHFPELKANVQEITKILFLQNESSRSALNEFEFPNLRHFSTIKTVNRVCTIFIELIARTLILLVLSIAVVPRRILKKGKPFFPHVIFTRATFDHFRFCFFFRPQWPQNVTALVYILRIS